MRVSSMCVAGAVCAGLGGWCAPAQAVLTHGVYPMSVLPTNVSADGLTVVGGNVVWRDNVVTALPAVAGGGATARGVSSGGTYVTGFANSRPFIWSSAGGMQSVPIPAGATSGVGIGVSEDGQNLVGSVNGTTLTRWNASTGWSSIPLPTGAVVIVTFATNTDLTAITGSVGTSGGQRGFRWTAATGTVIMPTAPGQTSSSAFGISGNGQLVVGSSGTRAAKWAGVGATQLLPLLTGTTISLANDASYDGSLIVGMSQTSAGPSVATVWTSAGAQTVGAFLNANGISTTGWTFTTALSISDDGHTIAGQGTFNGVGGNWIAVLPAPGSAALLGFAGLAAGRRRR